MNVQNERLNTRAALLNLLTAILWGGNSVSIKLGLSGIPPLCLAGMRFLLGGLVVYIWTLPLKIDLKLKSNERPRHYRPHFSFSHTNLPAQCGDRLHLASRSTIFISAYPFFTASFAHIFIPGDKISTRKMTGMVLSFLGVVIIFAESLSLGELQHLPGDILVLASAALLGARQVYLKRLVQNIHPGKVLIWQSAPSVPIFFLLSALFETQAIQLDIPVLSAVLLSGSGRRGLLLYPPHQPAKTLFGQPPLCFWIHHPNCRRHRQQPPPRRPHLTRHHPQPRARRHRHHHCQYVTVKPLPKHTAHQFRRSHYTPQEKIGFRTQCTRFTRAEYPATQNHHPCLQSTVRGARGTAPSPFGTPCYKRNSPAHTDHPPY